LNPNIVNDEPLVERLNNTVFHVFRRAVDYSSRLKLATLDLLHITYALQLASKGLIDTFVTLDRDMLTKTEPIEKLGLKICAPINAHERS
jgi:predicted nucleic acid-binding protein